MKRCLYLALALLMLISLLPAPSVLAKEVETASAAAIPIGTSDEDTSRYNKYEVYSHETDDEDDPRQDPSERYRLYEDERLGYDGKVRENAADKTADPGETIQSTYSGTCGANLAWKLDTGTGALTITGSGAMTDYEYGETPW